MQAGAACGDVSSIHHAHPSPPSLSPPQAIESQLSGAQGQLTVLEAEASQLRRSLATKEQEVLKEQALRREVERELQLTIEADAERSLMASMASKAPLEAEKVRAAWCHW